MKDNLKIYQKIRDLAHQGDLVYTRADLAYDLQELGIPNDCLEVGLLVWESYRHFNQVEKMPLEVVGHLAKGEELKIGTMDINRLKVKRIKI